MPERDWFQLMAEVSPVLIWVTDRNGTVVFVNRAYVEFFGAKTVADLRKHPEAWQRLVHPDDYDRYVQHYWECAKAARPFNAKARVRRKDGVWRWVSSYASPYFQDGHFAGMVGSSPDVTEEVELEERQAEHSRQQQRLLAMIAHELKHPLHPIGVATRLLKGMVKPDDSARGALDVIDREVWSLNNLVEDLNDLQRVATGKFRITSEIIDIAIPLRDAVHDLNDLLDKKAQKLTLTLPNKAIYVNGDRLRLCQVFINLLDNASKFSPDSSEIKLGLRATRKNAVVTVKDHGLGISPDKLQRIFEMFEQAHNEDYYGGMGLGLTLVRELVMLHGGTVEARSEGTGTGSEFVVTLPLTMK